MKKNHVHEVIIHPSSAAAAHSLADKISEFHYEIIERELNQSSLTTAQKIAVIEQILKDIKTL